MVIQLKNSNSGTRCRSVNGTVIINVGIMYHACKVDGPLNCKDTEPKLLGYQTMFMSVP